MPLLFHNMNVSVPSAVGQQGAMLALTDRRTTKASWKALYLKRHGAKLHPTNVLAIGNHSLAQRAMSGKTLDITELEEPVCDFLTCRV